MLSLQLQFCRLTNSTYQPRLGWLGCPSQASCRARDAPMQAGACNKIASLLLESVRLSAHCSPCSCLPGGSGLGAHRPFSVQSFTRRGLQGV